MSQTFVASADVTPPFSVHHEPQGDDWGYDTPLGAISTKGGDPLRHYADGVVIRRHHHHPAGTRCFELREGEPEPAPLTPPALPDWVLRPLTDPALREAS